MNKTAFGIILLIIGIIVLGVVYSMRPPAGLGEAFKMMWHQENYIKEPYYQISLAVGGIISVLGIIQIFIGLQSKKDIK